jgi:hypothetical protein
MRPGNQRQPVIFRSGKLALEEFFAALADEADDKGGPAGLVGGSEAFAGFAVEYSWKGQMWFRVPIQKKHGFLPN